MEKGPDSLLNVQTPEGMEFTLHPAGLAVRSCAWLIDLFIQGLLFLALNVSAGLLRLVLGTWFLYILSFLLNWFYYTAFEIFWDGQSPGKKLMGIKVVRGDGSPINPGASFMRNLMRFADTFFSLFLIGFLCVISSRAYRRIGDWTADTLVIYTAPNSGVFTSPFFRQSSMPYLVNFTPQYPKYKLGYEEKQAILSFARRYPLLGKARADEIAETYSDVLVSGAPNATSTVEQPNATGHQSSAGQQDSADSMGTTEPAAYILGIARNLGA